MLNTIVGLVKKTVVSSFLLYGYNLLSISLGILIPINIFTLLVLVVFGYPSLFSLILIQILIY